jgi:hypothetical protein
MSATNKESFEIILPSASGPELVQAQWVDPIPLPKWHVRLARKLRRWARG